MKIRQLSTDAMLAAMCAVLGYMALDAGSVKVTFESFPILLGALLLGPWDGLAVGLVGTTVYQLARYGVSVTTPLWIAPYALAGLGVGLAAKKRGFALDPRVLTALVTAAEVFITVFNTLTLYIDAHLFGYYFPGFITGALALRLALCLGKSIAFSLALPQVVRALRAVKETMHRDL